MLGQGEHQRRHDEGARDAILLQQPEKRLQLELGQRHERGAVPQAQVQDDLHPIDMEERQHGDDAILLRDVKHWGGLDQVRHEVAMRQHHALRESGGATRVRQHGEIKGRVDGHERSGCGRLEQRGEWSGGARLSQHE